MTSAALLADFEACTLDDFHHADHVHVAWLYLNELPLIDALARFTESLKRFAAHHKMPELYHETITWAFVALIHERMDREPADDWETFARRNPDLFTWKPSILDRYYTPETLWSERARRTFVLPDRGLY